MLTENAAAHAGKERKSLRKLHANFLYGVYSNIRIYMTESGGFELGTVDLLDDLRRFKAGVFQALAHPTRIAIAELLRDGEMSVTQLLSKLDVEQANISQHLAVMRSKQIVVGRKDGNQVLYRLRDPSLIEVLDLLKRYFQTHLSEALEILKHMDREGTA